MQPNKIDIGVNLTLLVKHRRAFGKGNPLAQSAARPGLFLFSSIPLGLKNQWHHPKDLAASL
jgi:hypothetical protein